MILLHGGQCTAASSGGGWREMRPGRDSVVSGDDSGLEARPGQFLGSEYDPFKFSLAFLRPWSANLAVLDRDQ